MSGRHSNIPIFTDTITNCSLYDCKDIGLISSHNTMYALTLVFIPDPNKAWFFISLLAKVTFFSGCNRSYSYALIIIWNLLIWETMTKRGKKKQKKKRVLASCRMSNALRGVVWSCASYSSSSANTVTSLNILRFIWRCFTVAVVMSFRAFWLYLDCRSPILYWELFQITVCAVVH